MYLFLKHVHIGCVAVSVCLFVLRYIGHELKLGFTRWQTLRVLPHAVDTLLLVSAAALALYLHQYPFVHAWLTAKVVALVLYIVFGLYALKKGGGFSARLLAFVLALLCVAYIVTVARTHSPTGFLRWL